MLEKLRMALSYQLMPRQVKERVNSSGAASFFLPQNRSVGPKYGSHELLQAYSEMPWLRAVVNKVGQAVSVTNWTLHIPRDRSGRAVRSKQLARVNCAAISKRPTVFSLTEVEEHPLLDLLSYGNEKLLGQTVFQLTQQHLDLVGEAFWILERNVLGTPSAIWPIPPTWVTSLPTKAAPNYEVRLGTEKVEIPVTEIIPFIDPDPACPYGRGSGLAKALGDELETDEYAAKFTKNHFLNRARPDVIISANGLNRDDTQRMEEAWLQKHQGFWNAFKPHFLNREVKITQLGHSFNDVQLVDLRKMERDTILQVYGLSPEILGILTSSNRSTIVVADTFFTKHVVLPRIGMIRNTLQTRLVPMFDSKLLLGFESPVVEDKELDLDIMRSSPGSFTKNEWRRMANMDSLGDLGDVFIMRPGEIEVPLGSSLAEQMQNLPQAPANANNNEQAPKSLEAELDWDAIAHTVTAKLLESLQSKK